MPVPVPVPVLLLVLVLLARAVHAHSLPCNCVAPCNDPPLCLPPCVLQILELESTADFPLEMEKFREVLMKVLA
jgi:hypothetical protein